MKNVILSLALLIAACGSTMGKLIPVENIAKIQKGKTTRAEVEAWFGPPMAVALTGEGKVTLIWMYTKTKIRAQTFVPVVGLMAGGGDVDTQTLHVIVSNETGLVLDYISNRGATEVNTGLANQ